MNLLAFTGARGEHRIVCEPSHELVLSWNASAPLDIDLRVLLADGALTAFLPYVRTEPWRSCSPSEGGVLVEADVLRSAVPIAAVDVRLAQADALFVATPPRTPVLSPLTRALTRTGIPAVLSLPAKSQYIGDERGWCGAASLAMVLGYWAQRSMRVEWDRDVAFVAERIHDHGYGGTGNWTFAAAYAGMLGLRAAVCYLRDLDHAERFIAAGVPLILSIAWEPEGLPGAPLARSDGHLVVLRGFDGEGGVLVHDPAAPEIAMRYPYAAFEAAWSGSNRIAVGIVPPELAVSLAILAN